MLISSRLSLPGLPPCYWNGLKEMLIKNSGFKQNIINISYSWNQVFGWFWISFPFCCLLQVLVDIPWKFYKDLLPCPPTRRAHASKEGELIKGQSVAVNATRGSSCEPRIQYCDRNKFLQSSKLNCVAGRVMYCYCCIAAQFYYFHLHLNKYKQINMKSRYKVY